MRPQAKETDESRFRRAELGLLKRAHRQRHLDMALGGLLIAAIVAVIFWLIGLSPPPPHEPESANAPESANEPRSQRSSVPSALSAGTRAPVASAVRA